MSRYNTRRGYRCLNEWGAGDLPAPYAEGDIIDIPPDAKALERMHGMGPGRYEIVYGPSVDEGDAWYFRVTPARRMRKGERRGYSDRLHVAWAERSTWDESCDWLEGCTLVETVDPEGLRRRDALIAAGWALSPRARREAALERLPAVAKRALDALDAELAHELTHLAPGAAAAMASLRSVLAAVTDVELAP